MKNGNSVSSDIRYQHALVAAQALLIFAVLGLGLALPYLLLSVQPAWLKYLPKPANVTADTFFLNYRFYKPMAPPPDFQPQAMAEELDDDIPFARPDEEQRYRGLARRLAAKPSIV